MTCLPAPIAKRSSADAGERETIRTGRCRSVTFPLAAVTVTGNGLLGGLAAATVAGEPSDRTRIADATRVACLILDIKNLRVSGGRRPGGCCRTNRPSSEG